MLHRTGKFFDNQTRRDSGLKQLIINFKKLTIHEIIKYIHILSWVPSFQNVIYFQFVTFLVICN